MRHDMTVTDTAPLRWLSTVSFDPLVIECFAGPGGWSTGFRQASYTGRLVGIEINLDACRTARAAGHDRIQADVAAFPIDHLAGKVDGVIQSPPCTSFTTTGAGGGRLVLDILKDALVRVARGEKVFSATRRRIARALKAHALRDKTLSRLSRSARSAWAWEQATVTALVLQPMRYVHALDPRWVALEQVPSVLPLWQHMAVILRGLGHDVWTGVVDAVDFGVPQNRQRAVLLARRDGEPVKAPIPSHGVTGDGLFDVVDPHVSMADALGWGGAVMVSNNNSGGSGPRVRGRRSMDRPSFTMTGKCGRFRFEQPDGTSRALTVSEAGQLQSFPADYPWRGGLISQQQQVGDAVPVGLARALLGQFAATSPQVKTAEAAGIVTA